MKDLFGSGLVVFDGAIGTELYERGFYINRPFEELNLSAPQDVTAVHRAYIEAGSNVLTTNTFSITKQRLKQFDIESRQADILRAALKCANAARSDSKVLVGLSMGPTGELVEPLGPLSRQDVQDEFRDIAATARSLNEPFDFYLLETFSNINELESAIKGIRAADSERPLLASISMRSGDTRILQDFAKMVAGRSDVQAVGLNCSEGPSHLLSALKVLAPLTQLPIVIQPNAGVPSQINGRYFYMTSPDYLAKYARRYVEAGAIGVGGCCGTGPSHVQAISGALRMMNSKTMAQPSEKVRITSSTTNPPVQTRARSERPASRVGQVLREGRRVVSIELSSPRGADFEAFVGKLRQIEKAGVEFVNVPDGPRASTRVSSLHLASAVKNRTDLKLSILPHFTTRDRNLIALQADLLGAAINGVSDVLIVTGDPPKLGNNKDATGVYDIDSIGLTHLVKCLNNGVSVSGESLGLGTEFGVGVAANPTAANLDLELSRFRYKYEMGADFAITQPIYDPESYFRWLEATKDQDIPHLVGIWPFISLRNAEFMANEVPGVKVPKWAIEEMAKAEGNPVDSVKRGTDIARRVMREIESACRGFCISAPLGKVDVALGVLD